eukprot:scaffold913_cov71-Cylindrotheca_fusiformis.AAC.1
MKTSSILSSSLLIAALLGGEMNVNAFVPPIPHATSSSSSSSSLDAFQTPIELDMAFADLLIQLDRAANVVLNTVLQQQQQPAKQEQAIAQVQKVVSEIESVTSASPDAAATSYYSSSDNALVEKAVQELEVAVLDMTKAVEVSSDITTTTTTTVDNNLGLAEQELEQGIADLHAATLQIADHISSMSQEALESTTATAQSASALLTQINMNIDNNNAVDVASSSLDTLSSLVSSIATNTAVDSAASELTGTTVSEAVVQMSGLLEVLSSTSLP